MSKALSSCLTRLVLPCLAVACLTSATSASADPYILTLTQTAGGVVANGAGAINLAGLSYGWQLSGPAFLIPAEGFIYTGHMPNTSADYMSMFIGVSGPTSFGPGDVTVTASSGTGPYVGIAPFNNGVSVPVGYSSEALLIDSADYPGATFASLGVTPGTYEWTWGTGPDQSFTLDIQAPVAEPSSLALLGTGLVGVVGAMRRKINL